MIDQLEGQLSLFDLDGQFTKTSPEHSQATAAETGKQSSRKSSVSSAQTLPMFLYLQRGSGANQDASWVSEKTDARFPSPGDYTMPSFGEKPSTLTEESSFPALPSGVSDSHLSQILEEQAHPKYSLSAKACRGILNRANRRGKELPEILRQALENQIAAESENNGSE